MHERVRKRVEAWEAPGTNGSWQTGFKDSCSQASSASKMYPTLWGAQTVQTECLSDEEHAEALDDILMQVQQVLRVVLAQRNHSTIENTFYPHQQGCRCRTLAGPAGLSLPLRIRSLLAPTHQLPLSPLNTSQSHNRYRPISTDIDRSQPISTDINRYRACT